MRVYRYRWMWVVGVMLAVSLVFYPSIWQQVIAPENPNALTIQGESTDFEFAAETVRINILAGRNPFAAANLGLFPHGWKFALDDMGPVNGFYFLLTRPFLSAHQSLMLITLLSVVAGGVLMDKLLITLGVRPAIAWVMALVFAFTPIVTARIGAHQTYPPLYTMVWPSLMIVRLIKVQKWRWQVILGLGLSWAVLVMTNLNYALMWGVMASGLLGCYWLTDSQSVGKLILSRGKATIAAVIVAFICLSPWAAEVSRIWRYEPADAQTSQNDVLEYSANVAEYFLPSKDNPVYAKAVVAVKSKYPYLGKTIEDFVYPGILLLVALGLYLRLAKQLPPWLGPIYGMVIIFFLLMLGPKLQVGSWTLNVPLPYSILAQIPYVQMARAPARFAVPMIFLLTIIAAYVVQYVYLRIGKSQRVGLLIILLAIFWIDQRANPMAASSEPIPAAIYNYLKQQGSSPLLEIPFAIRDGVKYHGYLHAHWNIDMTLRHGQPIFGVYAGRINNSTFAYFAHNPLLGPLGQAIDQATSDLEGVVEQIDRARLVHSLDFYGVKHVLAQDSHSGAVALTPLWKEMGMSKKMSDQGYTLWEREAADLGIRAVKFDGQDEDLTLLSGWSPPELGSSGRWAMTYEAEVTLSFQPGGNEQLIIEGSPLSRAQKVTVLINDEDIGVITFPGEAVSRQALPIMRGLNPGVNKVTLRFAHTTVPAKSWRYRSADQRPLALKVTYVGIEAE